MPKGRPSGGRAPAGTGGLPSRPSAATGEQPYSRPGAPAAAPPEGGGWGAGPPSPQLAISSVRSLPSFPLPFLPLAHFPSDQVSRRLAVQGRWVGCSPSEARNLRGQACCISDGGSPPGGSMSCGHHQPGVRGSCTLRFPPLAGPPCHLPSYPPTALPSCPPNFCLPCFLHSCLPVPPHSSLPPPPPSHSPAFHLSTLPASHLPTCLPSALPTFPPSYVPSFLPSYLPIYLPFLSPYLPSFPPTVLPSYRGTSLIRKRTSLGPYLWPMPRVLGSGPGSRPLES